MPTKLGSEVIVNMVSFEREFTSYIKNLFDHRDKIRPSFKEVLQKASKILPPDLLSRMTPKSKAWVADVTQYLQDEDSFSAFDVEQAIIAFFDDTDSEEIIARTMSSVRLKVTNQMEDFKKVVSKAIQRAHGWTGSNVVIQPTFVKSILDHLHEDEPLIGGASVYVGGQSSMTVFLNGAKVESVEDLLEGGDDDMFDSLEAQQDYMLLAKELINPGSSATGNWIKLWTARPSKDRGRYERNATTLPKNIFLVNSESHAEGLSSDLGGARDVWEVIVNTKDLIQTLNRGKIRYYQTTRDAPVRSMVLVG